MERQREQEAKDRARRKQWMDAEVEKLTAEYMEKGGGNLMKAAGFWFEREEQKKRQPWPGLEEGESFIENMKKDILDPVQLQREMAEEKEAAKRKPILNCRPSRARGLGGSKTVPAAPSVDSKRQARAAEQARRMPEAQQPASSTAINLTTPTKTIVNPKPPSAAASSKQLAPSTALQSAEMLSAPLNSTSPPPHPPEQQVLPSSGRKRKRKLTEAKILLSDLWGDWAVSVTETGQRPCVKRRQYKESESESE
ncbi:hypothetical protein F4782DRAFT_506304 [Xylaria castorea]|nr:hypothetical protein F4782DRAFT_506304 [Xylaria castorea]